MTDLLNNYANTASADLAEAHSLPFAVYDDHTVFELEQENIFRKDWVFVCAEAALAQAGDYLSLTLAGEAIAIIRGSDGQLRALSNICRHRGTPLLDEGYGNVEKHIVCPYHGWAYDQQGVLKAAPLPGSITINKESHCLPGFLIETWAGLVFVNLDTQALPLNQRLKGIDSYIQQLDPSRFDFLVEGKQDHWQANWKLAMENALESYHLFKVHQQTLETVTPTKQAYYVAGNAEWALTGGKMIDKSNKVSQWLRGEYPEVYKHYLLISIPPSFVGILSYDSFGWVQTIPVSAGETCVRSAYLTEKSSGKDSKEGQAFTEAFFAEDKWICERVHRGMSSRLGKGGKLVELERVVVDFHQYLANRMFNTPTSDFYRGEGAELFNAQ